MKLISHKLEEIPTLKYDTTIKVECDYCNSEFYKSLHTLKINIKRGNPYLFCNQICFHKFKKHSNKHLHCMECNQDVVRSKSQIVKSGNVFCSTKCAAIYNTRIRTKNHIPKQKPPRQLYFQLKQTLTTGVMSEVKCYNPSVKCICNCEQCKVELLRTKYELLRNKNGIVFCSRSCRMTYQNLNTTKKYNCRKSKAEIFLSNLIKSEFPTLNISENDRTILPSKLEIDIYIQDYKLGIELNGPVHYFPIYGNDRLIKCQNKDVIKQMEMNEIGISLITIDISQLNSKKKTEEFLLKYYTQYIKPVLISGQQFIVVQ